MRDFFRTCHGFIRFTGWAQSDTQVKEDIQLDDSQPGWIEVKIGDQLFTRYDYQSYAKPIFYPVLGPHQIPMTRSFPMEEKPGEATDHPHHKSMWLGHIVNGVDFWSETGGDVKHQKIDSLDSRDHSFCVTNHWINRSNQQIVLSDQSTYRFGKSENTRWIDATITFHASHGDVRFEDTKEGFFAVRTHPNLRLKPVRENGPNGSAFNSAGDEGEGLWGKNASWVCYAGTIDNQPCAIAMFDHPTNLRHPTTWHVREYGLVAANPFGLHYFSHKPEGAGALQLKRGETIQFRYRLVLIHGEMNRDAIDAMYREYASK